MVSGHVTTLSTTIPDAEVAAVRFFAVSYGRTTHPTETVAKRYIYTVKVSEELNRNFPSLEHDP